MKPEQLDKALAKGEIAPLYFFCGTEQYLVERGVKRLLARVVAPEFKDFNFDLYYGNECKGGEIVASAQTLPMFSNWRVVHVKRGSDLSTAALEVLTSYVASPSPTTCLIFQGEKIDQRKKFFTELKKKGEVIEYKRPYENQLPPLVREEAAAIGKKIESAAIDYLVRLTGSNLQDLVAQLEKCALYVGERETIALADVRSVVSDSKVDGVFDLTNSLGEKDLAQSLRHLHTILRDGEAPLMLLAMITRHFRQLWRVRELLDKKTSPQEIGSIVGINPFFLQGIVHQAKNFPRHELYRVFELLYEADVALKSGGGRPAGLMERLLLEICGVRMDTR